MKTTHMRVPLSFKKEIVRISQKQKRSMTDLLDDDGVRLFQNADYLSDFIGSFRRRKR